MTSCCKGLGIQVIARSPLGAPHKIEAFMSILTRSDAIDMRPLLKISDSRVLRDVASKHGVSAVQVALRWNVEQGHCVVPKSYDIEHIVSNTEIFSFSLMPQEMSILAGLEKRLQSDKFLQQSHVTGKKS